jgi:prepilin-type N-terminal cleavage/methylation domain-containing protein
MKKQKIKAFTFVELIVAIVILAILATIWFMNYSSNISETRNSSRISNLSSLKSILNSYKQDKSIYPIPWDSFNITNSWMLVAKQWFLNEKVSLSNIDSIPKDPYKDDYYVYSRFKNYEKYQLAATLESDWEPYKAYLVWNYNSVSKNVLPTIILAKNASAGTNIEIHDWIWDWSDNRKTFIFNDNMHNLPYEYAWEAISDGTDFDTLLQEAEDSKNFWQNTSFENCNQIKEAWEAISSWYTEEYQVRDLSTWNLSNINCTF